MIINTWNRNECDIKVKIKRFVIKISGVVASDWLLYEYSGDLGFNWTGNTVIGGNTT